MSTMKIAVIGECMIELSQKGTEVKRGFGGDTLNTAVYVARQVKPDDLKVHYVTALGNDNFSQEMVETWQQEAIDTHLVQRLDNHLPGLYYIETDARGERTFYYWRNEAAARFWLRSEQSEAICQTLSTFNYIYLSGISLAILDTPSRERLMALLHQVRRNGGKVIFDNNYRPRLWKNQEETQQVYREMLACTDIAFLTEDDEEALWGQESIEQIVSRTQQAGVKETVIKRGAEPCVIAIEHQPLIRVPAIALPKEKVVDTTAAGDSFSAGYLAVRLTGGNPEQSARHGHLTASTVIQHRGAIIPHEAMPV